MRANTNSEVIYATKEDLERAVERGLSRVGLTAEELRKRHDERTMTLLEAMTWVAIGDLI